MNFLKRLILVFSYGNEIEDPLQSARRGGGKGHEKDLQEVIDTLTRRLEMLREDALHEPE
jgi:hypothetical protein